jgi:type I restriction enzyme S subunit
MPAQGVPSGWEMTTIGQVATTVASGFPSGEHNQMRRGVPHIRPMNIDREGRLDLHTLKYVTGDVPRELSKGDVLFNNTNSPELIGKTTAVLVDMRLGYSNHMTRIRLEEGMNPVFVAHQLHFLWMTGYFRHRCVNHVNQASISAGPLSETVPLLVPPTRQQNRIADTLDELLSDLDAGAAAIEQVRLKLDMYRSSVLKAAVEGVLTANWRERHPQTEPASALLQRILTERRLRWEEEQLRKFKEKRIEPPKSWKERYKEPAPPDTTNLTSLPNGWTWATVHQSGNVQLGRQRAPQHHSGEHMRPYLRVANVFEDRLDLRDVKHMNFTPEEFKTYELRFGDILLNEGQSPELVGRAAMYRNEIPDCCYQKTLLRFRAHPGVLERYALSVFRSYLHNGRFRKSANITTSIAHLAAERFIQIEFPLPPLAEQEAIVEAIEDHLSVIDRLGTDFRTKLEKTRSLRHAILRDAFTGQLVTPDPVEEPASELLNRIAILRQERCDSATVRNKRRPSRANKATERPPSVQETGPNQ